MAKPQLTPRLRVIVGSQIALGPGKVKLLQKLLETGSITAAAKELGMSYMRAWTLIRTMNACFKKPLVSTEHGGAKGGGGAKLTATGVRVLELYRDMEEQAHQAAEPSWTQIRKLLSK